MTPTLQYPGVDSAISKFEGFGTPQAPTITQANNPGALQYSPFAIKNGAVGSLNGFAIFPDQTTGTGAEDALVQSYANQGFSIDQMINAWAPATASGNSPASTQNYVNSVANTLGASPATPVSSLAGVTSAAPTSSPGVANTLLNAYLNPFGTSASGTVTFARIGAFILGFILIAAGLYLFKSPTVINQVSPGPIGRGVNRGVRHLGRAALAAI